MRVSDDPVWLQWYFMTVHFVCQLSADLSNLFICSVPKAELIAHSLLVETLKCTLKSCLNHKILLLLIMLFQCQAMSREFKEHLNSLYLQTVLQTTTDFVWGTVYLSD